MKNNKSRTAACPCGSSQNYAKCCQPYVEQLKDAPTAEALMRSRYTAFVELNEDYLRYSWYPHNCPESIRLNINTKWLGLKIKNTQGGGLHDNTGEVEFVARNKTAGKASRIHENSRFVRENNRWLYVDGEFPEKTR